MGEEIYTWACKCGKVQVKLKGHPRGFINCHCHSCVACMEHCEKKGGTSARVSETNGGVAKAFWFLEDVEFMGNVPPSELFDFCKVGPKGSNVRSYTKCCGTIFNTAGGAHFPTAFRPFNRNCITKPDGSRLEPEGVVNVFASEAFDPAKVPEPKANTPAKVLAFFARNMLSFKLFRSGLGQYDQDKAFFTNGRDVSEIVPNTWDTPKSTDTTCCCVRRKEA